MGPIVAFEHQRPFNALHCHLPRQIGPDSGRLYRHPGRGIWFSNTARSSPARRTCVAFLPAIRPRYVCQSEQHRAIREAARYRRVPAPRRGVE